MTNLGVSIQLKKLVHKMNEDPNNCQDACEVNYQLGRYAVADGVAGSFFPAEWANLLVEHFCHEPSELNLSLLEKKQWQEWLIPIQQKWHTKVREKVSKRTDLGSYHLKNSLTSGEPAAATFVGLKINNYHHENLEWEAMVIGDSCLFYFNQESLTSYLIESSSEFDNSPECFSSVQPNKHNPKFLYGKLKTGDVIFLTTDAFAKWLLIQYEKGEEIWKTIWNTIIRLDNWDDFYSFVKKARSEPEFPMADDDVALIILVVEDKVDRKRTLFDNLTFIPDSVNTPNTLIKPLQPIVIAHPSVLPVQDIGKRDTNNAVLTKDRLISRRLLQSTHLSIIILVLSLVLALISLYFSIKNSYTLFQKNTPITTSDLRKFPTQAILFPTNINLSQAALVYATPDLNSQIIFTTITQSQASLIASTSIGNQVWKKVQTDLWVISSFSDKKYLLLQGESIVIQNATDARLLPMMSSASIGELPQGAIFQKIGQVVGSDSNLEDVWYQIRIVGFVLEG